MGKPIDQVGIDFFRHMVLNALRFYRKRMDQYGDLVIACDHPRSWRRDVFPFYKQGRKKHREASAVDWKIVHGWMDTVLAELSGNFPYPVIKVEGAEGDDVIASLVRRHAATQSDCDFGPIRSLHGRRVLIVSGDGDFLQLQAHPFVDQFRPAIGEMFRLPPEEDGWQYRQRHILEGDAGDGIPNALSPDDVFVNPDKRQVTLRANLKRQLLLETDHEELVRHAPFYDRNERLIDLIGNQCPEVDIQIVDSYNTQLNTLDSAECTRRRRRLLSFFIQHRLSLLTEHLGEF